MYARNFFLTSYHGISRNYIYARGILIIVIDIYMYVEFVTFIYARCTYAKTR